MTGITNGLFAVLALPAVFATMVTEPAYFPTGRLLEKTLSPKTLLQETPAVRRAESQLVPPTEPETSVMVQVKASAVLVLDRLTVC